MTKFDHGRVAARTLGFFFGVSGLVTLVDFAIHHQQAKNALDEMGWTSYGSLEEIEDQGAFSTFFHDTYYVVTPSISPIGSVGFLLAGAGFFVFSGYLGRLIGGDSPEPPHREDAP
ncbi:MAG: hypothetical protein MUF31_05190 [Akkermansiaceae bacterium]|jgi:hypothetical protein|nr:hypothetical protein [Akkermansiaceae bacterium]